MRSDTPPALGSHAVRELASCKVTTSGEVGSGLEKTSVATVATSAVVLYSCCEGIRGDGAHGLRQRLHHQADLATVSVVDEGGSWYLHGSPLCLSAACAGLARKYKMLHVQKPLQRDIPVLLHDGTIHSALPGLISPKFDPKRCPAPPLCSCLPVSSPLPSFLSCPRPSMLQPGITFRCLKFATEAGLPLS